MRSSLVVRSLIVSLAAAAAAACVPHRDLPPDQIEKLGKLSEVMDVQATVADPQFKKIGTGQFSDADWAELTDMGIRIQSTSKKIPQFSKGPEFDALGAKLHATAEKLGTAAGAKDVAAANAALTEMKATCKECHSKFK